MYQRLDLSAPWPAAGLSVDCLSLVCFAALPVSQVLFAFSYEDRVWIECRGLKWANVGRGMGGGGGVGGGWSRICIQIVVFYIS